jgi:hypothetical protein
LLGEATAIRPKISVTGGGQGVVGHAGAQLLADLADATGLTNAFRQSLAGLRQRQGGHDPDRIAVDVAVMLADGGEAIADLAVLRNKPALFGLIASDPTAWRLLSQLDDTMLAKFRAAWAQTFGGGRRVSGGEDLADAVGGAQGIGQPAVELGLVPLHLGQSQQLVSELFGARLGVDQVERQWPGDVHAGVGAW